MNIGLLKNTTACAALVAFGPAGAFAQSTVAQAVGANAEPAARTVASGAGFEIVIDGAAAPEAPLPADPVPSAARRADIALTEADLRVSFDGLNSERRLDLIMLNETRAKVGQSVRVESQLNYPAFVKRGEVRILDMSARGGPRVLATVPISPNGSA